MFINDLSEALMIGYKVRRPLLITSSPGIGKSDIVKEFVGDLGKSYDKPAGLIEVLGASINPGEMADVNYVVDGVIRSAPQGWMPTEERVRSGECAERGVIFLDELGDAMMSVQSGLQRLLLTGKLGSAEIAKGWYVVAATNRVKDKAAAGRISTALVNRCIVVQLEASADAFYDWGINNGIYPAVLAFVRFRPDAVSSFDPSIRSDNPAFTSPRSLEITSDMLNEVKDVTSSLVQEMVIGTLGDGVGSEFNGFIRIMDSLPDLNKILQDPENYPIPAKVDVSYATIGALTARVDSTNYREIMKYFVRFGIELASVAIMDLAKAHKAVYKSREFVEWSVEHLKYA